MADAASMDVTQPASECGDAKSESDRSSLSPLWQMKNALLFIGLKLAECDKQLPTQQDRVLMADGRWRMTELEADDIIDPLPPLSNAMWVDSVSGYYVEVMSKEIDRWCCLRGIAERESLHKPALQALETFGRLPSRLCRERAVAVLMKLVCLRCQKLSAAIYQLLDSLITDLSDVFLVVKLAADAGVDVPEDGTDELQTATRGKGWGRGLRSFLRRAYLRRTPEQLLDELTSCHGRYGWSHKDVLKLLHMKAPSDEYNLVFHGVMFGYDAAVRRYTSGSDRCRRLLVRFEMIRNFKAATDFSHAVAVHARSSMSSGHFQPRMLEWRDMWPLLIEVMTPQQLLDSLVAIGHRGFYDKGSDANTAISPQAASTVLIELAICRRLSNTELWQRHCVSASAVYIAERRLAQQGTATYLNQSKGRLKELSWRADGSGRSRGEYSPPACVRQQLRRVSQWLMRQRQPLHRKLCVVTDMRATMGSTRCRGSPNLSAMQAASLLNVHFKTEEQAVFVNFNSDQVFPWFHRLENTTLGELAESLQSVRPVDGCFCVDSLLQWSVTNSEPFDACICISSSRIKVPTAAQLTRSAGEKFKLVVVYLTRQTRHPSGDSTDHASISVDGLSTVGTSVRARQALERCQAAMPEARSLSASRSNIMELHGFDADVPILVDLFLSDWY